MANTAGLTECSSGPVGSHFLLFVAREAGHLMPLSRMGLPICGDLWFLHTSDRGSNEAKARTLTSILLKDEISASHSIFYLEHDCSEHQGQARKSKTSNRTHMFFKTRDIGSA
jgi:hypothetical protein